MKKHYIILFLFTLLTLGYVNAQERYLEEVFTNDQIVLTSNEQYATNATILGLLFDPSINEFVPEPLFTDIYEPDPSVDTASRRPVVIVIHGGDGLPIISNGACWGDKTDSTTAYLSKKLARMGYVVVTPNFRLGWNPLSPTQDLFLDGLGDMSFRISTDLRSLIRWLRKDIAEGGNTYNIASDKIALWGTASTGGTWALLTGYIHELEEVQTPTFFATDTLGNIYNIWNEMESGDLDGLTVGINALGDTTNYINTPGYTNEVQMVVSASGISLDPGIFDAGEPPLMVIGNPNSPVTQFDEGPIQLPTTGEVVAFVQLSGGTIKEANDVGLNDIWTDANLNDQYTLAQQSDPNFGDEEGWFPTYGDADNEYPFVWWDPVTCPASDNSFSILPGADRDKGIMQIDSMAGYFGPRACLALNLNCPGIGTAINDQSQGIYPISIAPNPSSGELLINSSSNEMIEEVLIYSIDGKIVLRQQVNAIQFYTNELGLNPGMYIVNTRFREGVSVSKLVVE